MLNSNHVSFSVSKTFYFQHFMFLFIYFFKEAFTACMKLSLKKNSIAMYHQSFLLFACCSKCFNIFQTDLLTYVSYFLDALNCYFDLLIIPKRFGCAVWRLLPWRVHNLPPKQSQAPLIKSLYINIYCIYRQRYCFRSNIKVSWFQMGLMCIYNTVMCM